MERRRAFDYKAERQAHFSKHVRQDFLLEGRKQKDAERARMEAYRRLCKKEGIHSQRLEEYDKMREEVNTSLNNQMQEINVDENLTHNEKKKRLYNLKRKHAATTVSEVLHKKNKRFNALTKVEEIAHQRQEERERREQERKDRETNKKQKIRERKQKNALLSERTGKGQPVMANRVKSLLDKITK
ncbi:hypothetical protein STCU_04131 [Strigomonas culicis]|uniref:rRNA processing protein n=1 Tax=Strigomonas culicis TaxID=28005 RepID=S9UNJ8_9TRYP|nr:hypothetical protein STCU_04131 [Strigomonas culicis]|eukprot:EPY30309.1 hypothetical protein STCU_04131 [Strigomonas culicis]